MAKNGIIAILDIGTSKIACFIAYVDSGGKIKVAGIGHQLSEGIRAGIVIDVKKAETAILSAINAAEKMSGETIESVVLNVSGGTLRSHLLSVETTISGQEVTDRDISYVMQQAYEHFNRSESEVIHCIPVDYTIDDTTGIRDPRGMYGEVLKTDLHVITASATAVRNMVNCLARCHLNISGYVCSPYVSGLACLTEDEKHLGVTLLDIGGGNTSIAVFSGGSCIYADSVALGGAHVTRDIAKGLSTSIAYAERIKTLYGSVVSGSGDDREVIDLQQFHMGLGEDTDEDDPGMLGQSFISKALLNSIIRPRVEEILEMAKRNLAQSGVSSYAGNRVVITGGAAQIQGMKELAVQIFGKPTRIGNPKPVNGLAEATKGPAFATAVGALLYAASNQNPEGIAVFNTDVMPKESALSRMKRWLVKG